MVHLLAIAEGYPDGIEEMKKHVEEACYYELHNGAKNEIGTMAGVTFREVRFFDITLKEDTKERFLSDLKQYTPYSYVDKEMLRKGDGNRTGTEHVGHGVKIGLFRKAIQFILGFIKVKKIDWSKIQPTERKQNKLLQYLKQKIPRCYGSFRHCHLMILGQIPDGFVKEGKHSKGREDS